MKLDIQGYRCKLRNYRVKGTDNGETQVSGLSYHKYRSNTKKTYQNKEKISAEQKENINS